MAGSDSSQQDERHPSSEVLVTRAMDSVLQSEREAQAALDECERECEHLLELSREQRRVIVERARARIVALHNRAAKALETRTTELAQQRRQAAAAAAVQLSDPGPRSSALERLTARLTGASAEPTRDGN
jgi:hypothetical protein